MAALERFFDSYYRLRPVNATFTGVHDHDHRLPDWSPEGLDAAVDEMRGVRGALAAGPQTRDGELAAAFLDIQVAEHDGRHFQRGNPSLAIGEVAFGIISLMTRPFADADVRAAAAAGRLGAASTFLSGARRSMTHGIVDIWREKA